MDGRGDDELRGKSLLRVEGPDLTSQWEQLNSQQNDLFRELLERNKALTERITSLGDELSVYKAGWRTLEKDKHDLEGQDDNPLIVCLSDGGGAVFSQDLLSQGKEGGRKAVYRLSEAILQYIQKYPEAGNKGSQQYRNPSGTGESGSFMRRRKVHHHQIMTNIYVDMSGIAESLVKGGICNQQDFAEFCTGFNQATPLFTMIDVGEGTGAVDSKLKESLLLFARLHQTQRLFFGGAHHKGHLPAFNSLKNQDLCHKLTILRGSAKLAYDMEDFAVDQKIRVEVIPGLFHDQDILHTFEQGSLRSRLSLNTEEVKYDGDKDAPINVPGPNKLNLDRSVTPQSPKPILPPTPLSGASPAFVPFRERGSWRDRAEAAARSESTDKMPELDPYRMITKQTPQLCNRHYLMPPCTNGPYCRYSHDYKLTDEQTTAYRTEVKGMPCPAANKNLPCKDGVDCYMSHFCPGGPDCVWLERGKCKFVGKIMHFARPEVPSKAVAPPENASG